MNRKKADLDWGNLAFAYVKTKCNIRFENKDGSWSKGSLTEDEVIPMHIAAPCLHYGQEAFEGLKAFETKDGRIVVFRPDANAKRLAKSCESISIPLISEQLFVEGVRDVVKANSEFVPPYGIGASLYIRPFVIGTGAKVGLGPALEYLFIIFVTPVGPYYKTGFSPVRSIIVNEYDRAAPLGIGDCKVGGNYAAGLRGEKYGKDKNYPIVLYLDATEKKYIDEFSTSNFVGIKGNVYVTPDSPSILQSITNDSLAELAKDMGMKIERRQVSVEELAEFDEVGAVGTAAVITPISSITYGDREFVFGDGKSAGAILTKLHDRLVGVQRGEVEDTHGWLYEVKL
ncbi:MAG: branched-chain amino acid aminotransferase [Leptospirales bacterium]|nr:branched-chain amino acid aminotransferase [Leptospirales bacterium]